MATWVTHLMIADAVLERCPFLDRRGFCVGNIAPDCNIENETWTEFTPPREVTHWMVSKKKTFADCERFLDEYALPRIRSDSSHEEKSFLLGYWAHLIADAEFQRYIRDEERVQAVWERIKADAELSEKARGMEETWDNIKQLFPVSERMAGIEAIEADYLQAHPQSGYLTEILPLTAFPDYIDYLPPGSILRKIPLMKVPSATHKSTHPFIALSREEYAHYVATVAELVLQGFQEKGFDFNSPERKT